MSFRSCARHRTRWRSRRCATPQSLMEHAYISREAGSGTREVIDHYLQKAGLGPDSLQVVMEAGSPEALKGLAATGLGFAIMSRATVAKEVRLGELVRVPLAPRLIRHLSVVYPKERFHSSLINSFVAVCEGAARRRARRLRARCETRVVFAENFEHLRPRELRRHRASFGEPFAQLCA